MYIDDLYSKRLKAKREGNDGLDYVYKTLMNGLYGRFGINPQSSLTEILTKEDTLNSEDFVPPRNAAVQISAAIAAYARIYMHPYIKTDDFYYTDTDSVVLSSPLPENVISSYELGKFQLVYHQVIDGVFHAPKSYALTVVGNEGQIDDVVVHKGALKRHVDKKRFHEQYKNPSMTQKVVVTEDFRRDMNLFQIKQKKTITYWR
jgi:hypothetical protein